MKHIIVLSFLFAFPATYFSQAVKFRDGQLPNGMTYPMIVFTSNRGAEMSINRDIEANVQTFRERDFCIGQYGFIQKASFLQIHIYANCIDMVESENYYYLYDMETGETATVTDMLNPKTEEEFNTYFRNIVKNFVTDKEIELTETESLDAFIVAELNAKLDKDGIYFTSSRLVNWGDNQLFVKWTDIQTFLKVTYI
ncbi:MAG: hypothetical protein ACI837_000626 [Crocinitomicaceae bacterium]|jgi:hypothetical protein